MTANFGKLAFLCVITVAWGSVHAATIYWNTWSSPSTGSLNVGGQSVAMTFATTNSHTNVANYPSWSPSTSFADGTVVANGPAASNGIMQLAGGTTSLNTLAFAAPVVDPMVAIWSLGSPSVPASFVFINATPVSIVGGPNAEYGGTSLTLTGNAVSGNEGNGTVRFLGTYSSISWTNPQAENWYGFNVGVVATVPEPQPSHLGAVGLAALALLSRARAKRRLAGQPLAH